MYDCALGDYDECAVTLKEAHQRRARKQHRCDDCRQPIMPGEDYTYTSWISDGAVCEFHGCARCRVLRECLRVRTISDECNSGGWVPYGPWALHECIEGMYGRAEIADLFKEANVPLWPCFAPKGAPHVQA